jgi:hypothetical protein
MVYSSIRVVSMLDKRVGDFGCSPNEICCGVTTSYIIGCLLTLICRTHTGGRASQSILNCF